MATSAPRRVYTTTLDAIEKIGMDNHTLIIPTYNRPVLLSDMLSVLEGEAVRFSIYVADSSRRDVQERNAERLARTPCAVTHFRYLEDIGFIDKVLRTVEAVKTTHLSLCADDDLPVTSSIEECLSFLSTHPDYAVCHGDYYGCSYSPDGAPILNIDTEVSSIEYENSSDRVVHVLMNYQYLFYSVCVSDLYLKMLYEIKDLKSLHFMELHSALSLAAAGKVKALRRPYIVRNSSISSIYDNRLTDPNLAMGESARGFLRDYLAMRRLTVGALQAAAPDMSDRDAGQAVDAGFLLYLRRIFASATMLDALKQQDLIGQDCRDTLYRIVHERKTPTVDPDVERQLSATLAPVFARGWPRGASG